MMSVQGWNFSIHPRIVPSQETQVGQYRRRCSLRSNNADPTLSILCSSSNVELVDIVHNKVLMAAAVSAAIGQLSKPFTSAILYGKRIDFRNVFRAGGFPSSHSSATVATATVLGLERGLSDAIFGLAVVYAGIVMYDAQGVRREVGTHAKVLNRILFRKKCDVHNSTESFSGVSTNTEAFDPNSLGKFKSENRIQRMVVGKGDSESVPFGCTPLKESVGHTEFQVIAGALLGFFVSIAVWRI